MARPAPEVADEAAHRGGVAHGVDADWGLDHGTWVPMMVMYPEAGMPAWLTATVTQGDEQGLAGYREQAPYATRAHPRPDHFMPLLVAYGAAGKGATGEVLHRSWYWGDLSMAAYQFAS